MSKLLEILQEENRIDQQVVDTVMNYIKANQSKVIENPEEKSEEDKQKEIDQWKFENRLKGTNNVLLK